MTDWHQERRRHRRRRHRRGRHQQQGHSNFIEVRGLVSLRRFRRETRRSHAPAGASRSRLRVRVTGDSACWPQALLARGEFRGGVHRLLP